MEPKRVAVYCRVSTLLDVQDSSFETQRDAYIQMIDGRDDLVLADVYGDHGRSGASINRRLEFQRMLRDCEDGKIDIVMTKSISRFARNLRDCLTTIGRLRELGIPVLFEKEGIDTMDARSELLLNVLAVIAEEESLSIGQNMRWAYERRNAAGDPFQIDIRIAATGGTGRPIAGTSTKARPGACGMRFQSAGGARAIRRF